MFNYIDELIYTTGKKTDSDTQLFSSKLLSVSVGVS